MLAYASKKYGEYAKRIFRCLTPKSKINLYLGPILLSIFHKNIYLHKNLQSSYDITIITYTKSIVEPFSKRYCGIDSRARKFIV